MVPVARITHRIKGRIRIRVPMRKGNREYFSSLEAQLRNIPGVTGMETNALTGSVLIFHETDPEKMISYANESGLFRIPAGDPNGAVDSSGKRIRKNRRLTSQISDVFKQADSKMLDMSDGRLDIGGGAFMVLLGLGIYDIARGNFIAPAWYTAFWYALNIFLKALPGASPELSETA